MALFDYKTFTPEQAASLVNIPGKSLAETNTPEQIKAVQANPGVITPNTLTPTQPLAITNPAPTPITPPAALPDLTPTLQEQTITAEQQKQRDLNNQMIGKSAYQTEQNTKFGVDTAQANINDLNAQLVAIKNEAAQIPLDEQSRAAKGTFLTGGMQADQNQRLRDNAVKALGVSTLLAASQGQLANAQAMADKAVAQKYDPILEQITANKANLDLLLNDPATTLADKNRAQKQLQLQEERQKQIEQQKTDATEIWKVATDAASKGNNFQPSGQYQTLSQALTAISKAKTKEEALNIAMSTGLVKDKNAPAVAEEYNYAVSQGYKGSFLDYQKYKATQYGTENGSDKNDQQKKIDAFRSDLAGWDLAGTREQFIRRLQAKHPDIALQSIKDYVYYTYPDGYNK